MNKFIVYSDLKDETGIFMKEMDTSTVVVETEQGLTHYEGVGAYLADGWQYVNNFDQGLPEEAK